MILLSKRIRNIKESGIRKVFDLAAGDKGKYINFSIGQPHFRVPKQLRKAMADAVEGGANKYAPTRGIPELQQKIAKKLVIENNIQASPDDVIVTSGVSGALFLLFGSILDPGDEVIVPDPYFVLYKEIIIFLGGTPVYLDTYPDFRIDPKKLKKLITKKTKALIINSPNNPTGMVYAKQELSGIADVAEENNLLIISDEIYEKFDYDNKFFSIASIYKNTITLNGFSKSLAVTGWRVGYAHGPSEIIEAMNKLQQYTFVCAPTLAQFAIAKVWSAVDLNKEYEQYRVKRDGLYRALKDKYDFLKPEGAFYAFIKISKGDKYFIDKLISQKLLVVPGEAFSNKKGYFRISFAIDDKELKRGLAVLRSVC